MAERKFYLDSMVHQREGTIIRLENKVVDVTDHYTGLFWKTAEMSDQKDEQIESLGKVITSQAVEIKNARKKDRWQKITNTVKDGGILLLVSYIVYQEVKE